MERLYIGCLLVRFRRVGREFIVFLEKLFRFGLGFFTEEGELGVFVILEFFFGVFFLSSMVLVSERVGEVRAGLVCRVLSLGEKLEMGLMIFLTG